MSYSGILEQISVSKIIHPENQIRMNLDSLDELANSIKQHGLLQPIVIRPILHKYEVVAGNRRLAAVRLLKLRKIYYHVAELSDKEAYEVGLVENVQHKSMNAIEEAFAFKQYAIAIVATTISDAITAITANVADAFFCVIII